MGNKSNTRLTPEEIAEFREIIAAVKNLHDYAPMNQAYSLAALIEMEAIFTTDHEAEGSNRQEGEILRDRTITSGQNLKVGIKGLRAQFLAQYGDDSYALHAVGLKKRSERKRPTRRTPKAE